MAKRLTFDLALPPPTYGRADFVLATLAVVTRAGEALCDYLDTLRA